MKKINVIWVELESDISLSQGLLYRRYSPEVLPDVFVALKIPEKNRCIAAFLDVSTTANISSFSNLKDIRVDFIKDDHHKQKKILLLSLLTKRHEDIFSVLCEDLITKISDITSESQLIKELLSRIEKWRSLFEQASLPGLSPEEQRGLFGELYFLKKLLQYTPDFHAVLKSWVGPDKEIRDFQLGDWSVEVKTTTGKNHQRMQISNERQLDTSTIQNLYLNHISLESQQNNGITLNQIVDDISGILSSEDLAFNKFLAKLFTCGYFDSHRDLYNQTGYYIRGDHFYRVEKDFPRVEEGDLRPGVGDLRYTIIVSYMDSCRINETDVLNQFQPV
jgi:hypothetical protein